MAINVIHSIPPSLKNVDLSSTPIFSLKKKLSNYTLGSEIEKTILKTKHKNGHHHHHHFDSNHSSSKNRQDPNSWFTWSPPEEIRKFSWWKIHLHQYTATKSFSLRSRSSCFALTSSMTGSVSLWPPLGRDGSSDFAFAAASTVARRAHNTATTPRRTIVFAYPLIVVGPQVVLLLRLRQHHHHRPKRTVETSFAVDIAALTGTPAIFDFSDSAARNRRRRPRHNRSQLPRAIPWRERTGGPRTWEAELSFLYPVNGLNGFCFSLDTLEYLVVVSIFF